MNIKIIAIGKIKENYLHLGIDEYLKRMQNIAKIEIKELKEQNTFHDLKNLELEGKMILEEIKDKDYVISLVIEGKMMDSLALTKHLNEQLTYDYNRIVFIIGSSCGLAQIVKNRSDLSLSFGLLTYPHQLMRLILVEQIYRSLMITNNTKYHK